MDVVSVIRGFIDKIFKPPITFLNMAIEKLQSIQLVTSQGLNIGKYLSIFGDMPTAWQLVISSIFASIVLLGSLLVFRAVMRMYFTLKEGVKWW